MKDTVRPTHRVAAVCLTTLAMGMSALFSPPGFADPLHKVGTAGTWRHEDSGWLFQPRIADFARVSAPYTIDGNNDVGARYEHDVNGVSAMAIVDVYSADSFADEAKLAGAKAAIERAAGGVRVQVEEPFTIHGIADLRGTKVTYESDVQGGREPRLYFFATEQWAVKIRIDVAADESSACESCDAFVRAQSWDRLGVPGDHGVGS